MRSGDGAPPGLLTWQVGLLAWLAGALALDDPVPAGCGLALLCLLDALGRPGRAPGRRLGRVAWLWLAGAVGLGAAWLAMPVPPDRTPSFVLHRENVLLRGRVEEVASRPGGRLRALLAEVEVRPAGGEGERLPGRLAWTWQGTAGAPLPGESVEFRAVVKPVRGFLNEGTWDGERWYARQGVFWRAFTRVERLVRLSGAREEARRTAPRAVAVQATAPPSDRTAPAVSPATPTAPGPAASPAAPALSTASSLPESAVEAPGDLALAPDPVSTDDEAATTALAPLSAPGDPSAPGDASAPGDRSAPGASPPASGDDEAGTVVVGPPEAGTLAAALVPLWRAREGARTAILDRTSPGQGQALLVALVLGEQHLLAETTRDLLKRASLAHCLALSGQNVAYVAALALGAAWLVGLAWPASCLRLPRPRLAVLLAAPLTAAYCWLGLASPSLIRATVMFFFCAVLLLLGRRRVLLDGLGLALAVLVLPNPLLVRDTGLQLSALAVAGMIFLLPPAERLTRQGAAWLAAPVSPLAASLAAQAGAGPLLWASFGSLSPHLWLNAVWLPVQGLLATPLGLVGLGCALVGLDPLGGWLLELSARAHGLMLDGLVWLDAAGWLEDRAVLRPHWSAGLGYYVLLTGLVWIRGRGDRTGRDDRGWAAGLGLGLLLLLAPVWSRLTDEARRDVRLTLLDVGQGQAVLITAPGGGRTLIDGGGAVGTGFDVGEAVVGPALTANHAPVLDGVLLSHPDADHLRGLFWPLSRFAVGWFGANGDLPKGADLTRYGQVLALAGLTPRLLAEGDEIELGSGLRLEVLWPPRVWPQDAGRSSNARSLVLRLVWEGRGLALIPGDADRRGLAALAATGRDLAAELLVLPHHGSRTGLCPPFLAASAPRLALASCAYLNRWGLPHPRTRAALAARGTPLATTAESGMLQAVWDGPLAPARLTAMRPPPFALPSGAPP